MTAFDGKVPYHNSWAARSVFRTSVGFASVLFVFDDWLHFMLKSLGATSLKPGWQFLK
ncbi:MAG: hypothetical protein HHJ12_02290 [Glaciimonas sp.]|nr:hypothetical protein [Glaciimonas sp.]